MYVLSGDVDYRFGADHQHNRIILGAAGEKLVPGAVAQIKYFESGHRRFDGYAEEVSADGQRVVTYDDDIPPTAGVRIFLVCMSLFLAATAVLVLKFSLYMIRDREKKERMREQRIEKKYGKKTS